jgi:hypothetical protein
MALRTGWVDNIIIFVKKMKPLFVLVLCFVCLTLNAQQDLLEKNKALIQKELKTWIATFKNFKILDFKFNDSLTSALLRDTNDLLVATVTNEDVTALLHIYNKSKNYAIDLYSGQATLQYKKGKYDFENVDDGGPVYLHNLKNKKTHKIEYNSLSYYAEEAFWLTDSTFILAFIYNDNDGKKPTLYYGNTKANVLYTYTNKNEKCVRLNKSYTSKKLLPLMNKKGK